jgi:HAD superfamily hydrolase (TIGR01509 family)
LNKKLVRELQKLKTNELVIFDCDGVLVDSETITNALMIDMLKPHRIVLTREEYVRKYVGLTIESCLGQLSKENDVVFPEGFITEYHRMSLELLRKNVKEVDGVRRLIERLEVPFCVASNSADSKVKLMLEATDLFKYFTGKIFSSTHVSKPKPAPDVYLMAARANNIKPEYCSVIEDTPTGIKAAKATGIFVYGFQGLFPGNVLKSAGADIVFDSMDQLF